MFRCVGTSSRSTFFAGILVSDAACSLGYGETHRDRSEEGKRMTTTIDPPRIDVVSADDVQDVISHALELLGMTFDHLAKQAATHHFDTIEARLTWLAIGGLYGAA
jgi:hypothetical protein